MNMTVGDEMTSPDVSRDHGGEAAVDVGQPSGCYRCGVAAAGGAGTIMTMVGNLPGCPPGFGFG